MNRALPLLVAVLSLTALAQSPRKPARKPAVVLQAEPQPQAPVRGPARLELEGSFVKGQLNTSGSVYLVERKQLPLRSMIVTPRDFRSEIFDAD